MTIVEMLPEVARDAMFINKISLMNGLAKNQVRILTDTKVVSIQEDGVTVEKQDGM